jgi:CRISPR/Cas system CSM-associated protein Csm3 (group 7 of RAMP superfamily)
MKYQVITATLTARTAIHIGSGEGSDLTDALVRRDAHKQPFIPGTAIAGALRSLLTRLAPRLNAIPCAVLDEREELRKKSCNCEVCHLFGDVNPSDEDGAASEASKLLVFNAGPSKKVLPPMIRDGVGIERATGVAARAGSIKFDLEVIPAGAVFELRIELRDTNQNDESLLAVGLAEWKAGRFWLGGRVARGLGAFTLSDMQFKTLNLDTRTDVLAFLENDKPWEEAQRVDRWFEDQLSSIGCFSSAKGKPETIARSWFSLAGTLQADGPLLTNDGFASGSSGFAHAPLLAYYGNWQQPVLTGAGLRGVLRSHAEKLARTLAILQHENKDDYLHYCPACDPNVREDDEKKRLPLECCDSLLKKSHISGDSEVSLCMACRLFGSTRRGSRLFVEDAPFQATAKQSCPIFKMFDFLAIDRFTGGGAEGLKFDALAMWKPAFALRLYLDNPEPWELGWLWLVLRDLIEGWLTIGFGSAKGFGQVKLTNWAATFGYIQPEDAPLDITQPGLITQKSGIYTSVQIEECTENWREIMKRWINAFHEKANSFERPEDIRLTEDSYFDYLEGLYPLVKGGSP